MRWKKSLLVTSNIVRLFVNAMTADDKDYMLNRGNLTEPIQRQLSKKQKTFSQFFFHFQNLYYILNIFWKRMTLIADVFPKLRLRKTSLGKFLKSRVSEDRSKHNITNVLKHCCNLNDSTFTVFINHCEDNCVRKSLF